MTPWLHTTVRISVLIGMIISWAGMVIPAFPAPLVMWAFTLVYGIIQGFGGGGILYFVGITVLTIGAMLVDNVLTLSRARMAGAGWTSLLLAFAVGLISSVLFTPLAGIPLTLLALYLTEYARKRDADQAWHATKSMLFAWGWAAIARLSLGFLILLLWVLWAWV